MFEEETMASKQTEALNALYRGWAAALQANPEMPLDEMRLMLEQWGNITGEPRGVDYIETSAGEVPALWAAPKNCAEDRVLLCAHGGGYVAASMYTHRKTYGHVAKAIGCRALIVDYRRAPENVHPGPVNDMAQSYKWLLDQGIRPGHVALIGDSAGGALAVMYIQTGADEALLDDSRALAELARKSGVDVTLEVVPEMQHVFQFLAGTAPEADAAIQRLADWVRPKLGLG